MIDRADFLKTLKHCTETGLCDWIDAQISAAVAAERDACAAICDRNAESYPDVIGMGRHCAFDIRIRVRGDKE